MICGMSNLDYIKHFAPYAIIYVLYLILLHLHLNIFLFILSFQESIFIVPLYLRYLILFIFKQLGCRHISFRATRKTKTLQKFTIPTFFIISPYILYYLSSISLLIYRINIEHTIYPYVIDIFWILCINCQLINPFLYIFQNIILSFVTRSDTDPRPL